MINHLRTLSARFITRYLPGPERCLYAPGLGWSLVGGEASLCATESSVVVPAKSRHKGRSVYERHSRRIRTVRARPQRQAGQDRLLGQGGGIRGCRDPRLSRVLHHRLLTPAPSLSR